MYNAIWKKDAPRLHPIRELWRNEKINGSTIQRQIGESNTMLEVLLLLNALWFFGGFVTFGPRGIIFAKKYVAREHRNTPAYELFLHTGSFMAGFNFAFMVLSILLLANINAFDKDIQWSVVLAAIAVAHGSQFLGNVPTAIKNFRGEGVWNVWSGLMLLIFTVDFSLMALNAIAASVFFF